MPVEKLGQDRVPPNTGDSTYSRKNHTKDEETDVDFKDKLVTIAEIVQLLEEKHKGRPWLLDKIKRNRLVIQFAPQTIVGLLKLCPTNFVLKLLDDLRNDDMDAKVEPPPLTTTYHWFFTDIIASSDPGVTTNEQARKIIALNKLIEEIEVFSQRNPSLTLILPTGDGMAIGFKDSAEKPMLLAIQLHKLLQRYNSQKSNNRDRISIRIGLDTGPVYMIKDLTGNDNVWGPGIITARRVMDLATEMNILASARIANDIKSLRPEYRKILHAIGDYSIKHNETLLIYNVYGEGFGNKKTPRQFKIQRSAALEESQKTVQRFLFNRIEVTLKVIDVSNMLTHHTMLWDVTNMLDRPIERVFYYLDGDVPRSFPDLNIVVKDQEGVEQDIMSLNVNKPYHKEFYVKMKKPLKPHEKGRSLNLEYDWEESDRKYHYRFAANCKRFTYLLSVPKEVEVNQKVVDVDTFSGEKSYNPIPAVVKYHSDRTEISWAANNLQAYKCLRFDW